MAICYSVKRHAGKVGSHWCNGADKQCVCQTIVANSKTFVVNNIK